MWLATQDAPRAGDIAFYSGKIGNPIDEAVMLRTRSKFVHVAVFLDDQTTLAAVGQGIVRQPRGGEAAIWRPDGGYVQDRLHKGLDWLVTQIGKAYGYADIVNQVLLLLDKDPVLLNKSEDCSDLACRFLWIAGVSLPATLIETNTVTPGMLHDALDLLTKLAA